ncbi:signal peptidase I [Desulfofalx alkaliphila]|uniref:signal peptidase I n=1 Tax=Desulfofalx alkaliphila TaxID=105483 RepID=UPI0004E11CAF|nr:signal peptidase I [Desulfofalx alkaliphila]
MQLKYQPTTPSKRRCFLLIGLVLGVCFLETPPVAHLLSGPVFTYVIKPLLWLGIALTVWCFPRVRPKAKLRHGEFLNWWALNFAVIFIAITFLAGLLDGFGKSPYSHSLSGIAINILVVGSPLIAMELVRNYLVNSFARYERYRIFILVALVMTFAGIPLPHLFQLRGYEDAVIYIARYFAPEFCHGLFATYLAFLGGALPAIIYMGTIKAVHWLSPILPDLQWITKAFIGVLVPVFSLSIMHSIYSSEAKLFNKEAQDEDSPFGWIVTIVTSILIVWFAVGVFSIYPSVIATGSMEPMIKPGDVILVQKIRDESDIHNLSVGDVIQFERGSILISHRIIDIVEEDGNKSFRTMGDNNSIPDSDLVEPPQIKGEIIKVVPKVGWPTLLIKSDKSIDLTDIQF